MAVVGSEIGGWVLAGHILVLDRLSARQQDAV